MSKLVLVNSISFTGTRSVLDICTYDNIAYLLIDTDTTVILTIYDISNPINPILLSAITLYSSLIGSTDYVYGNIAFDYRPSGNKYLYVLIKIVKDDVILSNKLLFLNVTNASSPLISFNNSYSGDYITIARQKNGITFYITQYSPTPLNKYICSSGYILFSLEGNPYSYVPYGTYWISEGLNQPTIVSCDDLGYPSQYIPHAASFTYIANDNGTIATYYTGEMSKYPEEILPEFKRPVIDSKVQNPISIFSFKDMYLYVLSGNNSNISSLQEGNFVEGHLRWKSTNGGNTSIGAGCRLKYMNPYKIISANTKGLQIFDIKNDYAFPILDCFYGGYESAKHYVDTYNGYIYYVGARTSSGFMDIFYYDTNDSSSSSFSIIEISSSISSESSGFIITNNGLTYYNDFKDINFINNSIISIKNGMQFDGYFNKDWDYTKIDFNYIGYGVSRKANNHGLIFSKDASKLISIGQGCVSMILQLPYAIINGIYEPLANNTNDFNEYILWGTNIGQYGLSQPGFCASLTPRGLEFIVYTSKGKFVITDNISNISPNSNTLYEFIWDANGIFDSGLTFAICINGELVAGGNPLIYNDFIEDTNFCVLNTPYMNNNYECIIRRLAIYNKVPFYIREIIHESSSDDSE